jgi:hypothetical protein
MKNLMSIYIKISPYPTLPMIALIERELTKSNYKLTWYLVWILIFDTARAKLKLANAYIVA